MIQSLLPGRRLADAEPTPSLCRDLARTLRTIHSIPIVSGFGNLRPDLRGATEDLALWFTGHVRAEATSTAVGPTDRGLLGTPWPTEELIAAYDEAGTLDRDEIDRLRRLVRLRIWTRQLVTASRGTDLTRRATAARSGLAAELRSS